MNNQWNISLKNSILTYKKVYKCKKFFAEFICAKLTSLFDVFMLKQYSLNL